jgi:small subunit ribosomal protein S17
MADEEKTDDVEATPEAPAAEEAPAQTPEPEVAPDPDAPEADADTGEPAAEPAAEAEAEAEPEPPAEPEERLTPKQRRTRTRSAHKGEARATRTPQERQTDRDAERRRKAAARTRYRAKVKAKKAERRASEPPAEPLPPVEHVSGTQKVRQGVVVSDRADKTITVRIDMVRRHRRYQKIMRSTETLHAHDETNNAHAGDTVRVVESRPLSRLKRWRLVEVVERAK